MRFASTGMYHCQLCHCQMCHCHPAAWLILVNGFILDARSVPREIQEKAFRKGLIPYLPGERD